MKPENETKVTIRKCAEKTEVFSRVCGFFRPVSNYNVGKQQEFKDRNYYRI